MWRVTSDEWRPSSIRDTILILLILRMLVRIMIWKLRLLFWSKLLIDLYKKNPSPVLSSYLSRYIFKYPSLLFSRDCWLLVKFYSRTEVIPPVIFSYLMKSEKANCRSAIIRAYNYFIYLKPKNCCKSPGIPFVNWCGRILSEIGEVINILWSGDTLDPWHG